MCVDFRGCLHNEYEVSERSWMMSVSVRLSVRRLFS